jgi:predicted enzyme related to lactoylglutathione lyase
MTSRISQVTLDVVDVAATAKFWAAVLDYTVQVGTHGNAMLNPPAGGEPTLWLQAAADTKSEKLRCHIDLRTTNVDRELERLLGLGARRVDIGQRGDEGFTVLSDPEGNEFCLLHRAGPRRPGDENPE